MDVNTAMRATETRHGSWEGAMTMGQAGLWADEVLLTGGRAMNLLPYPHWVSAGTALGLHRDGDFIPHDTDLDVGLLARWGHIVPDQMMLPPEFKLVRSLDYLGHPMQRAFLCGGVIFDVYIFWVAMSGEPIDHAVNVNDNGVIRKPMKFVSSFGTLRTQYGPVPAPHPIEDYLEWRYGPNWRTPTARKVPWEQDAACLEDS